MRFRLTSIRFIVHSPAALVRPPACRFLVSRRARHQPPDPGQHARMRKKFPETFCLLKVSTGGCDPARRTASAAFPACRAASSTTPGVMLAEVFVGLPEEERKIAVVSLRVSAPVAALPALRTVVVTL